MAASKLEAEKDNVVVPTTLEEYCIKHRNKPQEQEQELSDFYADDYCDLTDDIYDGEEYENGDDEDSGNSEC